MTPFLDVRLQPVGGELSTVVATNQGTSINDYTGILLSDLLTAISGKHVLIATHGFNVNRGDGIYCLANWNGLLQLPPQSAFVGLLWPGDSVWAHGLDYAEEPRVADDAGKLLGPFIDKNFAEAASISFASHSLGVRVLLKTIANMSLPVRRAVIMAGAIDDNCLTAEFEAVAGKIGQISVLASKKDEVLSAAFPLGNFFAGIIDQGHPWWRAALGHRGHTKPWPPNYIAPDEIPNNWNYQHGNYLQTDDISPPVLPVPTEVPPNGAPEPAAGAKGWQEAFSAAFASTRFK